MCQMLAGKLKCWIKLTIHCFIVDPSKGKDCGEICVVEGDIAGECNITGQCSFELDNLGCRKRYISNSFFLWFLVLIY